MNKALKIVMYTAIVLITLIFLFVSCIFIGSFLSDWPQNYQCWQGKGSWVTFSSGCHDECYNQHHDMACMTMFSQGCDCGPEKCWNGNKCIKDGDWQPS